MKNDCREIFPVVGSGKYITAPVITEDGQPISDPLVLAETSQGNSLTLSPTPRFNRSINRFK